MERLSRRNLLGAARAFAGGAAIAATSIANATEKLADAPGPIVEVIRKFRLADAGRMAAYDRLQAALLENIPRRG